MQYIYSTYCLKGKRTYSIRKEGQMAESASRGMTVGKYQPEKEGHMIETRQKERKWTRKVE